jgi:hypothetical protein
MSCIWWAGRACWFAGKIAYQVKGPRGDPVTRLQDKSHTTCLEWLPASHWQHCFISGTAHHKLRLYDVRAQKRPTLDISWRDARVTSLSAATNGELVWAGNAKGCMQVCKHHRVQAMAVA